MQEWSKFYRFYIPHNWGIYYIVICIRRCWTKRSLLNNIKNIFPNQIHCILSNIYNEEIITASVISFNPTISFIIIIIIIALSTDCYYSQIWSDLSNRQKKNEQTSVVVILVKNKSYVLQAQIYLISTDALFLPFHNIFLKHKLIFGPSSLGVGHEICI